MRPESSTGLATNGLCVALLMSPNGTAMLGLSWIPQAMWEIVGQENQGV